MRGRIGLAVVAVLIALAVLWQDQASGTHAELTVDSKPQGAAVTLDGQAIGVTPVTRAPLLPGPHTLHLSLAGYAEISQTVTLTPGDRRFLEISLVRPPR